MPIQHLQDYNEPVKYMNRQLEIWGQPCTVYIPRNKDFLGYENMGAVSSNETAGSPAYKNTYDIRVTTCFINFKVTKSVFYKFNFFPKDGDELVLAYFKSNNYIREGCYIRTATPEAVSIWGDLLFEVVRPEDTGIYKTLKRTYFLKPTANADLQRTLTACTDLHSN